MIAVTIKFPIFSAMRLPITLNLYIVNFPVLISIYEPLTIFSVLRAAPARTVNNTSSILQKRTLSSWKGFSKTTHSGQPGIRIQMSSLQALYSFFLLCQSPGCSCLVASRVCWTSEVLTWKKPGLGGCSGRGREP